ncbi:MAG: peptidylprolyl isomerase [Thermoanaerobaculum sp.]|nr:peptidylprolyl isomerase [Thermoanaerobaculum sp.]MDW7967744.1 peptidylprolyl isomerase [Thermoanaerobaculum sp.]
MKIGQDTAVTIHYTLKGPDGQILDSSLDREPLTYLHGHRQIIFGLEQRLEGAEAGAQLDIHVPAAEAYGPRHQDLVFPVRRRQFDPEVALEPGVQVVTQGEEGPLVLTIVGVEGDTVLLDANHPLAGMDLDFSVQVVSVRAATPAEIAHGHVHA